jgi:Arc/MetJ-type ribon-helix-helix transcriptional regulator
MDDITIAGESLELLRQALLQMKRRQTPSGMWEITCRLEPRLGLPLFRAVMRVEAELLLLDADSFGEPDYEQRTHTQRRADAFVALVVRIGDALGIPMRPDSMVSSMATKKVTITLPDEQVEQIRALVAAGSAPSVSGFVQHSVGVALDDVAGWGAMLAEALTATGGPLSDAERAWADDITRPPKRRRKSVA